MEIKMKKILIVDDRMEVLKLIGRFLDKKRFVVYLSDSSEKALRLCREKRFDLVISDFDLDEGTGIELIDKIKKRCPEIKTILMSGSFRFDKEMLRIERIDAFLEKPFDAKELESLIREILDSSNKLSR
jgi:DNA-binding NtrC family response regulator